MEVEINTFFLLVSDSAQSLYFGVEVDKNINASPRLIQGLSQRSIKICQSLFARSSRVLNIRFFNFSFPHQDIKLLKFVFQSAHKTQSDYYTF